MRKRRRAPSDVAVGAITLIALVLGVGLVLALEGKHLRPGIRIQVKMRRTGALKEGALVRIAGLELGRIDRIALVPAPRDDEHADEPAMAILHCWIARRHAWLVREDSIFFVNQTGLLGDSYLEVGGEPGRAPGPPLADGAVVDGIAPPRLDRLLQQSYKNLEAATALIRDGMPEIEALGAELDTLEATLSSLEPAPGEALRAWVALRALGREGAAIAEGLEGAPLGAARDHAGETLERLAQTRDLLAPRLESIGPGLDRLRAATGDPRVAELIGAVDRARSLIARTERVLAAAEELYGFLERGRGTLGALLQDNELADEFKDMTKRLKRQPWEAVGHPSMKK